MSSEAVMRDVPRPRGRAGQGGEAQALLSAPELAQDGPGPGPRSAPCVQAEGVAHAWPCSASPLQGSRVCCSSVSGGVCSRVRAHTSRGARGVLGLSGTCPLKLVLSLVRCGRGRTGRAGAWWAGSAGQDCVAEVIGLCVQHQRQGPIRSRLLLGLLWGVAHPGWSGGSRIEGSAWGR